MTNKRHDGMEDGANLGAGVVGRAAGAARAASTDAMMDGMRLFLQASEGHGAKPLEIRQGNLFEYIEAAKFNANAALKGSDLRAVVTDAVGRGTDPRVDIEIRNGPDGPVVKEVQAKSFDPSAKASYKARAISQERYNGTQKVTNPENVEDIRRVAAKGAAKPNASEYPGYQDTVDNITGETHHENVRSGGTSHREATRASESPKAYAASMDAKFIAKEAAVTGGVAAASAAVVGGAISAVKNYLAVQKGEISSGDAVRNTVADAGRSAVRGGATGVGSTLIRVGAQRAGVSALAEASVATAIAAGLIDVGVSVYRYTRGEISGELLRESLGRTGVTTSSGIYAGAVAGMVLGPAGALVGSVVGYMLSSYVYESCLAITKHARLAEAEALRVEQLCAEAVQRMREERAQFEQVFADRLRERKAELGAHLTAIDAGLRAEQPEETVRALTGFAASFGRLLRYNSFEEFDTFMRTTDDPLRI